MTKNANQLPSNASSTLSLRARTLRSAMLARFARIRWQRALIVMGGVLSLVAVLGFLVLPPVLRPIVEAKASEFLGRKTSIQTLSINPFSLTVRLKDLRIADAQGGAAFVSIAELYANLDSRSLWRLAPVLRELRIVNPQVRVVRETEDRFSFSDIVDRIAAIPADPDAASARFAIYNIQLQGGDIQVEDRVTTQTHRVQNLSIGLPFVSNLPSNVDTFVTPSISAAVNGSPFALSGVVKPFSDRREALLKLKLEPFGLQRYLAYLPQKLPFVVKNADLSLDVDVLWREANAGPQTLVLQGGVSVSSVEISMRDSGEKLLQFERLNVSLKELEPLTQPLRADISKIELIAPQLNFKRDAKGSLSLASLQPKSGAKPASKSAAAAPLISIGELIVQGGGGKWRDESVPGGFDGGWHDLSIKLTDFDLAGAHAAKLAVSVDTAHGGKLSLQGALRGTQSADLNAHADTLNLGPYLPYMRGVLLRGNLTGVLDGDAHIVAANKDGQTQIHLDGVRSKLSDLRLTEPGQKSPLLQIPSLEIDGVSVDLQTQQIVIGDLRSQDGKLVALRDEKGRISILQLLQDEKIGAAIAEVSKAVRSKEWGVSLKHAAIKNWAVSLEDRGTQPAVRAQVDQFSLELDKLSNQSKAMGGIKLSARVNRKGSLAADGALGIGPLRGDIKVTTQSLDVLIAQPYVNDLLRVLITRGELFAKGALKFDLADLAAPQLSYRGDVSLRNFNSLDTINDTDFLRWKNVGLSDLDFQLIPLSLKVRELKLDSIYTRLILDQQGRFNLRELQKTDDEDVKQRAPAGEATKPSFDLRVDRIVFENGDINYSDRFIRPNYDAHLLHVTGSVEGLSTDTKSLAKLSINAALDGNAPVSINGALNPFRQDRHLDINTQVSDVDLTAMSAYSAKYVGYGISRGKLSMRLDYKIRERKLTAENQVFLDQLTFGEKVESPDATDLPVQFAVALLTDSQGKINLNLPIGGSLDDPEFSVGGIIWQVIGNVLSKAITAPFALIGSLLGGGDSEELSFVSFEPGLADITPASLEKLISLSTALQARAGLRLDVSGFSDPAADTVGLKNAQLDAKLRAIKAERLVRKGESVAAVDQLKIGAAEREELLREVYKEASFEKPRNALGFVRELPIAETEKAILNHMKIVPADLNALANQRANNVRVWLTTTGGVASSRVFLLNSANEKSKQVAQVVFALR